LTRAVSCDLLRRWLADKRYRRAFHGFDSLRDAPSNAVISRSDVQNAEGEVYITLIAPFLTSVRKCGMIEATEYLTQARGHHGLPRNP